MHIYSCTQFVTETTLKLVNRQNSVFYEQVNCHYRLTQFRCV